MQTNPTTDPVFKFLQQAVITRHGVEKNRDFISLETNRIYDDFGSGILDHFKPMIKEDKQKQLNLIVESQQQETILAFLMESIDNFEQKIIEYLMEYKEKYISGNVPRQ